MLTLLFLSAALLAPACVCVAAEEDPTEPLAGVVVLEKPEQPIDFQAPASQFNLADRKAVWERAWARIQSAPTDTGGGFFDAVQLLGGEGFRVAKDFHAERYGEGKGENSDELQLVLAADEASRQGREVHLTRMRVIFFKGQTPFALAAKPAASPNKSKRTPGTVAAPKTEPKPPQKQAGLFDFLPTGGRVVMTAPKAVIDLNTNEGRASGAVTLEIFPKTEPGKPDAPIAVLTADHLYWRTWQEPALGSTELALYTGREKNGQDDTEVRGRYIVPQPDGNAATMEISGRGLIFETASYDKMSPVYDEDFRTAGKTDVARNRAVIRKDVRVEMTATTMSALMPFQTPPAPPRKKGAPKDAPPPILSKTVITCQGPAILDLAAVPRVRKPAATRDTTVAVEPAETDPTALKTIDLGRRMEFLNGVLMRKAPLDEKAAGAQAERSEVSCQHLCLQYPPGGMPGVSSLPEYAEAVGGVKMAGTNTTTVTAGAGAPGPATPFSVECARVFYDNVNDNMFLVGTGTAPVRVKAGLGEAEAQQFNYRSRAETLTMPATGPKRLVMFGRAALADQPAGALNSGQTVIRLRGPLVREVKHLPTPQDPKRTKEVLSFKDGVVIEQPGGGLRIAGQRIKLIRSLPDGELEYLEGDGGVSVTMGALQATGDTFSVKMKPGEVNAAERKFIQVVGDRKTETKATLFRGGSAICADKFVLEMVNEGVETFRALGGAVAVFKAPPQTAPATPKSDAAQAAGALFKGISFQPGGNMTIQCDGELSQDASRKVSIRKNVIIRQPDLQLLADDVYITMVEPASLPAKTGTEAGATGAEQLFTGQLKSIDCIGGVELATSEQVVQCDRLSHEVTTESSTLAMDDPENDVRIYLADTNGGTRFLSVQKSLRVDGKSGLFQPGGMLLMLPYRAALPVPRDKESSPARKKKTK